MASLALRPANASEEAKSPAGVHDSTNGDAPAPVDEDVAMDDDIDESLLRDQLRQQQDERAQRLQAKNRRKRYLEVHPEYFSDSSLELADPLLYDRLIRRFQTASEREAEGRKKGFSGQMATDLWRAEAKKDALSQPDPNSLFTYNRGPQGQIVEEDKDDRFLRGGDEDFEYEKLVDKNPKYDDPEQERDLEDAYFDSMESDFDSDGEGKEKVLTGETGIQDY
ncbi:unnamed protein product [Alternaria alternata]